MPGDGAMGGLIFSDAVGGHQYGGHHGQRSKGGGNHVAHHIAIVILAGPDVPSLRTDHPGYRVINEGVEIRQPQLLKSGPAALEFLLKDLFELSVIDLGNGVLGGEPQILPGIDGVLEAGAGEGPDGRLLVVGSLPEGWAVYLLHGDGLLFRAVIAAEGHGAGTGLPGNEVHTFVDIAVGVPGDGNRLLPVFHHRLDGVDADGGAEHGAVQDGADGAVRTFPHLRQLGIFLHSLLVGGNGGALHRNAVFLGSIGGVHRHLVPGLIAVEQAQVVILGFQIHERKNQFFFYHRPQNAGHFIPVHLYKRGGHFDLFHGYLLFSCRSRAVR